MARISSSKYKNIVSTSGNLDSVASGTTVAIAKLANAQIRPGTLSATYVVDAETSTLTIAALWQGSVDGSNWIDIAYAPNNPAAVVLATGTAGADAAVTKAVPAPEQVAGFRFVRAAVVTGGTTGTTSDTYAVTYNYVAA